jgi:hypothetical protein
MTKRSRRDFLTTAGMGLAALQASSGKAAWAERKRIAFLGTEVRQHSHAQHFLDRHAMGYNFGGRWQTPRFDIASVYIDQFPEGDLAKSRVAKYKLNAVPTIEDALTLGTGKLAVDGVVIIAEHGEYPVNEKGQKRYPRYDWFKKVVKVFEDSGRSVPVFNDKHLSTVWSECKEMVDDSKRLGFAFLAGSSLPVTWRMPATEIPRDTPLRESVCVCYGGVDSYDIHGLETAQCMSERRRGGEVGVKHVLAVKGDRVWQELERADRKDTQRLFVSALTRSHNLPVEGGYPTAPVSYAWAKETITTNVTAYFIEHNDGFKTAMFLCPIQDFNYAGMRSDNGEMISCQMYLPMPTHGSTTADFFNPLARHVEDVVLTGRTPYPIERTLLTSGMVIAGVDSLFQKQTVIETPHLNVRYQANPESAFWRE